jgi:hypothetical protein
MDDRTPDQLAYEEYLSKLPRPERRRIIKGHWKRILSSETAQVRARDTERHNRKLNGGKHATA